MGQDGAPIMEGPGGLLPDALPVSLPLVGLAGLLPLPLRSTKLQD